MSISSIYTGGNSRANSIIRLEVKGSDLIATYTDGQTQIIGSLAGLNGKDGENGTNGTNGLSAYELAVQEGYSGTQSQWIASLKGQSGQDGDRGLKGDPGLPGQKGDQGITGAKGDKGDRFKIDQIVSTLTAVDGKYPKKGKGWTVYETSTGKVYIYKDEYTLYHTQGYQFKGEQGLPGIKGDTGEKGDKGDKGNFKINQAGDWVEFQTLWSKAITDLNPNGEEYEEGFMYLLIVGDQTNADLINADSRFKTTLERNSIKPYTQYLSVRTDTSVSKNSWSQFVQLSGNHGIDGPKGDKGDTGKSAYQVWLDAGNSGSVLDFFNAIKGPQGDKGDTGEQGPRGIFKIDRFIVGITPELNTDASDDILSLPEDALVVNTTTGQAHVRNDINDRSIRDGFGLPVSIWKEVPLLANPATGDVTYSSSFTIRGDRGYTGDSAFELWKELYGSPTSTEEDFIDAIRGPVGPRGDFRISGWVQGTPPHSITEITNWETPEYDFILDLTEGAVVVDTENGMVYSRSKNTVAEPDLEGISHTDELWKVVNLTSTSDETQYTYGFSIKGEKGDQGEPYPKLSKELEVLPNMWTPVSINDVPRAPLLDTNKYHFYRFVTREHDGYTRNVQLSVNITMTLDGRNVPAEMPVNESEYRVTEVVVDSFVDAESNTRELKAYVVDMVLDVSIDTNVIVIDGVKYPKEIHLIKIF